MKETTNEYRYNSESNEFQKTFELFASYISYKGPLTYEEWLAVEDDRKAAVLYVQFFKQITYAWYKVKSFYTSEQEGVEVVLQYLCKNVPVIQAQKSRFSAPYIYKVAYNCMYCVCHDIKRDRERWENEISNIVDTNDSSGDTVDLFDLTPTADNAETYMDKKEFWQIIQDVGGDDAMTVVELLINQRKRIPKKYEGIIQQLRIKLEVFKDVFYA